MYAVILHLRQSVVSAPGNSGNGITLRKPSYHILHINQTMYWSWTINRMLITLFIWAMKLRGASCPIFRNFWTEPFWNGRVKQDQPPPAHGSWHRAPRNGGGKPRAPSFHTQLLLLNPLASTGNWAGDNFKCQHYLFFCKNKKPKTPEEYERNGRCRLRECACLITALCLQFN